MIWLLAVYLVGALATGYAFAHRWYYFNERAKELQPYERVDAETAVVYAFFSFFWPISGAVLLLGFMAKRARRKAAVAKAENREAGYR